MAYKKQEIIDLCLKVIDEEMIVFQDELIAFIPISEATFYSWKLQELEELKSAIKKNKINTKNIQRKMWCTSESPVLQLASYRLMAEPEEHRLLATNYTDITTQGEKVNAPVLITMSEAKKRLEDLDGEI